MRYKLIFILLLIGFFVQSKEPVNIGIKYGTNSSTMQTNLDVVLNQNIQSEDISHHLAGAFMRLNLRRFHIQPEVYFNTKGGIIKQIDKNKISLPTATTFKYQTVDVPVLLGYKILNGDNANLRINAGPVFSFITANDFKSDILDLNSEKLIDRYIGWQIGAGFDIWFISVDARMENSSNILTSDNLYTAKNRVYILSVGIKIF